MLFVLKSVSPSAHLGFPLEVELLGGGSSDVLSSQWPQLLFTVLSRDSWGRERVEVRHVPLRLAGCGSRWPSLTGAWLYVSQSDKRVQQPLHTLLEACA